MDQRCWPTLLPAKKRKKAESVTDNYIMAGKRNKCSCERLQFSIGGKFVIIQQMSEFVILVSKQVPIC